WLLRLRLGDLASLVTCITPVLGIATLSDVASYFDGGALRAGWALVTTVLGLISVVLFLPGWLGRWMGVVNLPEGELCSRITAQLRALKVRGVRPKLVPSGGRWPGAAIVGWLPRFRQLWLGDALVQRLSAQQLDMVLMHELAHV